MIELTVLASGSQANCAALVVGGKRLMLIDAGLSPRATRERLFAAIRRQPEETTDLLLTHLDADHYREGWNRLLRRHPIRVWLHQAHARQAVAAGIPETSLTTFVDACDFGDGFTARAIRAPHDEHGTSAFAFEWRGEGGELVARLGYATDLGRVPETLHRHLVDLDVLAIESNYDSGMQLASDRPRFLKRRIMGGRGHLSNEQSLASALRVANASELQAIVLLHLSRQCNCPELVRTLWQAKAAHLADRMVVSSQFAPTRTITAAPRPRRAIPVEIVEEHEREPLLFDL
ncbi:MAG: MBL fold metallo-hydrolase [Phycisphaerales bacterium]